MEVPIIEMTSAPASRNSRARSTIVLTTGAKPSGDTPPMPSPRARKRTREP
jgi:hypothetical protein